MKMRLVVSFEAMPGKGNELAAFYRGRCREVTPEPGCLQFEVFQSVENPDRLTLLELWESEQALAVHAEVNKTRAPLPPGLRGWLRRTLQLEAGRSFATAGEANAALSLVLGDGELLASMFRLRTLLGDHPVTAALKRGEISSPLVTLDFAGVKVPSTAFKRTVRELEFDVFDGSQETPFIQH